MKIKILYEDSNILVIDKPSGIAVHPDGKTKPARPNGRSGGEKTVTDWVIKNYSKMKSVGEPMGDIARPGVVHRLDKETSGVMVLAKNQKSYEHLKSQFQNREIKKVYHAIVSGSVRNDRGVVNKPIGRSPRDFRRYLSGRGVRGEIRDAITEYRVLKRFQGSCAQNFSGSSLKGSHADKNFVRTSPFTYLEVRPKTGRTHQIRVHMKYLNHPVACDSLYNPDSPCPRGISRLALHAMSIELKNLKGETIKIKSPIPKEFAKFTE